MRCLGAVGDDAVRLVGALAVVAVDAQRGLVRHVEVARVRPPGVVLPDRVFKVERRVAEDVVHRDRGRAEGAGHILVELARVLLVRRVLQGKLSRGAQQRRGIKRQELT